MGWAAVCVFPQARGGPPGPLRAGCCAGGSCGRGTVAASRRLRGRLRCQRALANVVQYRLQRHLIPSVSAFIGPALGSNAEQLLSIVGAARSRVRIHG